MPESRRRSTLTLLSCLLLLCGFVVAAQQPQLPASRPPVAPATPLRDRIQVYLDEWRASSTFPGVAVGVVLKDGTAVGVVSGVSDRTTAKPMTIGDRLLDTRRIGWICATAKRPVAA